MDNITMLSLTTEELGVLIEKKVKNAVTAALAEVKSEKPRMYTREETAEVLHVTLPTLWQWAKSGKLCPVKCGKRVLYSADIVNTFASNNN